MKNHRELIANALKEKILYKLGNTELVSVEVGALVDEIGEIVVQLQSLYLTEIARLEKKVEAIAHDLTDLEDETETNKHHVTVHINNHFDKGW